MGLRKKLKELKEKSIQDSEYSNHNCKLVNASPEFYESGAYDQMNLDNTESIEDNLNLRLTSSSISLKGRASVEMPNGYSIFRDQYGMLIKQGHNRKGDQDE